MQSSGDSLPRTESAGIIIMQTVQFVCFFPLSVHNTRKSRPGPTVNLDGLEIEEGHFIPERWRQPPQLCFLSCSGLIIMCCTII